jgi:hypothetical protein
MLQKKGIDDIGVSIKNTDIIWFSLYLITSKIYKKKKGTSQELKNIYGFLKLLAE